MVRFRLRRARFARDVPVSGTATWRIADGAVRATLRLPGRGRLRARWSTRRPLAVATLDGTLGGRRLRATMLAPDQKRRQIFPAIFAWTDPLPDFTSSLTPSTSTSSSAGGSLPTFPTYPVGIQVFVLLSG